MKITLYNLPCLPNELNKQYYISKTDTPKLELTGTLREQCSLQNPSILLQQSITAIKQYNYVSIPSFDRYYFISEVVAVRDGLTRIELSCDVLSSFRGNIIDMNSKLFCERWSGSENIIKDNFRDFYLSSQITENPITNYSISGAKVEDWSSTFSIVTYGVNYVITMLSNESISHNELTAYEVPTKISSVIKDTMKTTADPNAHLINLVGSYSDVNNFLSDIIKDENKAKAIVSIRVYPFNCIDINDPDSHYRVQEVKFGSYTFDLSSYFFYLAEPMCHIVGDFKLPIEEESISVLDYENKYKLWLPFDKWIDLDLNSCKQDEIMIVYQPIYTFGECNIYVVNVPKHSLIYNSCVNIATESSVTYSNAQSIKDNYTQALITGAITVATGAIMTGASGATGNALGVALGASTMASGVANTYGKVVSNALTNHETLTGNVPTGNSGMLGARQPRMRWIRQTPVISSDDATEWENYKTQYGLPYQTPITGDFLEANSGTFFFGDCQINFDGATKGEIDQVKTILRNGITNTNV